MGGLNLISMVSDSESGGIRACRLVSEGKSNIRFTTHTSSYIHRSRKPGNFKVMADEHLEPYTIFDKIRTKTIFLLYVLSTNKLPKAKIIFISNIAMSTRIFQCKVFKTKLAFSK